MHTLTAHDTMNELLSKQEKATITPRVLEILEEHTKEKITALTYKDDWEDEGYYNFLPISNINDKSFPISNKVIENTLGKSILVVEM